MQGGMEARQGKLFKLLLHQTVKCCQSQGIPICRAPAWNSYKLSLELVCKAPSSGEGRNMREPQLDAPYLVSIYREVSVPQPPFLEVRWTMRFAPQRCVVKDFVPIVRAVDDQ